LDGEVSREEKGENALQPKRASSSVRRTSPGSKNAECLIGALRTPLRIWDDGKNPLAFVHEAHIASKRLRRRARNDGTDHSGSGVGTPRGRSHTIRPRQIAALRTHQKRRSAFCITPPQGQGDRVSPRQRGLAHAMDKQPRQGQLTQKPRPFRSGAFGNVEVAGSVSRSERGATRIMLNISEINSRIAARVQEFLAAVRTVYADLWDHADRNSTGGPAT